VVWDELDWNDDNLLHATRHGVSADEIRQALLDAVRARTQWQHGDELRLELVGYTEGGRHVTVIAQRKGPNTLRPITAWEVDD